MRFHNQILNCLSWPPPSSLSPSPDHLPPPGLRTNRTPQGPNALPGAGGGCVWNFYPQSFLSMEEFSPSIKTGFSIITLKMRKILKPDKWGLNAGRRHVEELKNSTSLEFMPARRKTVSVWKKSPEWVHKLNWTAILYLIVQHRRQFFVWLFPLFVTSLNIMLPSLVGGEEIVPSIFNIVC